MNTLTIDNNYSTFITQDLLLREELWNTFRFKDKNCFHNRAYKMKIWSGFIDFYKKENGKFLSGLLPEFQYKLKQFGVKYDIVDKRKQVNFTSQNIDESFLGFGTKLRDYQIEYVNKLAKYKRGIVDGKTGLGKTMIMVSAIKNLPVGTKILVLCNRKSLVEQNYNELMKYEIPNIGRVYDKHKEPNTITCSTVQSSGHIEDMLPHFEALFCDESHLLATKSTKKLYNRLTNCSIRIGMSATPFKFGGKDEVQKYSTKGWLGPIIKLSESSENGFLSMQELQKRNILSTLECKFIRITEPVIKHAIYLDAVTKGLAENEYLHDKVKKLATSLKGRTLILVDRIAHGDRLKELIPDALWIQGKDNMETRKYVIEQLTNQESAIGIASSAILSVGINVFIHNMIYCCDSKAEHVLLQALGRGLRMKSDKSHLHYYDFMYENNSYLHKHSKDRVKILKKEGHKVDIVDDIDLI